MNPCLFLESDHADHDYTSQIAPDNSLIGKKYNNYILIPVYESLFVFRNSSCGS